ncbi:MAG: S8 family serine peptidase [Eubacterium sp.]|nr:S8 family serine peptidase [Eubacterium sp.]
MKRIKRVITVLILVMALFLSNITIYASDTVAKTKLKLNKNELLITIGDKADIKVTGLPKGQNVTWKISNKKLLKKVKSSKKSLTVKALKSGKTSIKAKSRSKTLTCKVTIEDENVRIYRDHDEFGQAVADMIISHEVKSSAAIAATDRFFTGRLIAKAKTDMVSFSEFGPQAVIKDDEDISIIQFETSEKAKEAFQQIAALPDIEWVEPDLYIGANETGAGFSESVPTSNKSEDLTQGAAGEDASSGTASRNSLSWGVDRMGVDQYAAKTPKNNITVAVVDTGVASHPFLSGRLVAGYDYIQNDNDPTDQHFHGTHVAGTVVDCTPGLNVKIMPVRVLDASGYGTSTTIGLGVRYAADHGASVINLSLGGGHTSYEDSCIQYALNKGVTVVCAAGNNSSNTSTFCPAHIGNIIVVSALDEDESRAYFSNYGNSVDVAAPGMDILSCVPGGDYEYLQGTSMASPHIAGIVAMLRLNYPDATPAQIESTLKLYCRDLGTAGWDAYFGYGIPDMTKQGIEPPKSTATPKPTAVPTVKPTAKPTVKPTVTPVPTYRPIATQTPVRPTTAPVYPTYTPVYPTYSPVYPTYTPVYPTFTPVKTPTPGGNTGREQGFLYRVLTDQTAMITGYEGSGGDISIPLNLGGYPVSGIGDAAFKGNSSIRSVRINTIVWIGASAFEGCGNLTQISIDSIVSGVASRAFAGNRSLSKITITGMLFQVQPDIFADCPALASAYVPGMIDSSVQTAFKRCSSLTDIRITGMVTP